MSAFFGYLVSELSWTDLLCSTVAVILAVVSSTIDARHARTTPAGSETGAMLRERRWIARDLHDGVGHGLTVIALQARRLSGSSATGHHVAQIIEETAQATLEDLRKTLAALRHEPSLPRGRRDLPEWKDPLRGPAWEEPPRGPSRKEPPHRLSWEEPPRGDDGVPLSTRLTELAGRFPFPDLAVRLRNIADERHVPPEVAKTAFRVAQEALTNALKHNTGPVRLDVCFGDELSVSVVNETRPGVMAVAVPVPFPGRRVPGGQGGAGLPGLSERVAEQGGHLESGPLAGGGFATRAVIPVTSAIFREDEPCGRSVS
ncbi:MULTISPECIES: sensor histidine kinase [unclassified Streptosporangium]|uniref:sensor histidine kinase n=1 Tax=unclassified Streptosporangium TaxID=2632669 RepID=UPI002E2E0B56|nr:MULTISPECIES: histidine kinase [unclassified Streptosporangium]